MISIREIQTIKKLLTKAIAGELLADELFDDWKESWNSNRFLMVVFDDLEN